MEGKNGKIRLINDSLGKSAAPALRQSPAAVGLRLIFCISVRAFLHCCACELTAARYSTAQKNARPDTQDASLRPFAKPAFGTIFGQKWRQKLTVPHLHTSGFGRCYVLSPRYGLKLHALIDDSRFCWVGA
jgi:hypothetical protein